MIERTQKSIPPKNSLWPQTNLFSRIFPSGNESFSPKKSQMRGWKINAMPSGDLSAILSFFDATDSPIINLRSEVIE